MDGRPGHCLHTHAWTRPSRNARQQHAGHIGSQQGPSPPLERSSKVAPRPLGPRGARGARLRRQY
eukprot:6585427-Lingulodinium_polyedra.AAC.1